MMGRDQCGDTRRGVSLAEGSTSRSVDDHQLQASPDCFAASAAWRTDDPARAVFLCPDPLRRVIDHPPIWPCHWLPGPNGFHRAYHDDRRSSIRPHVSIRSRSNAAVRSANGRRSRIGVRLSSGTGVCSEAITSLLSRLIEQHRRALCRGHPLAGSRTSGWSRRRRTAAHRS
jgi:hypothetical protein